MDGPPIPLAEKAPWVVHRLQALGVEVPPGSRFDRYATRFASGTYQPWSPDETVKGVEQLMALRDVEEMAKILAALPNAPAPLLAPLVKDAIVPRLDSSTPGRDRQLELYFAAVCSEGGMDIQLDREPDLWACAAGAWLGLAVKRLRGAKSFEDRVEEAAQQVQIHAPWYGLVCIDVGLAWNPDLAMICTDRSPDSVALDNRERLFRRIADHEAFLHRMWAKYPKSLGILFRDFVFVNERDAGLMCYQYALFHGSSRNNRHRVRIWESLQRSWMRGVENCTSLDRVPRTGFFCGPTADRVSPMRPRCPIPPRHAATGSGGSPS